MKLAVLAAWLHDIGKFALAANCAERANPAPDSLAQAPPHILCTDYFIRHMSLPPELEKRRDELARLATGERPRTRQTPNPQDKEERARAAIRKADALAVGLEGVDPAERPEAQKQRLGSIFSRVRLGGRAPARDAVQLYYPLLPQGDYQAIFPVADAAGDYPDLWNRFTAALSSLPTDYGPELWQASLVSLLEQYCWCVPSVKYVSQPDVSLYDHAAATAAIAQAMLGCPEGAESFLLYGGDLSGIQAYIFGQREPADRGAARLLRARSFLLQAVTRSVWLQLLKRLQLDPAAKVMDAGGRFMLLLPNTDSVRTQLDKLETDVQKWLLKNFLGTVRLNFARLSLTEADLSKEAFAARFSDFNDALEKSALSSFSHVLGELPVLPVEYELYGETGECAFCRTRPASHVEDGNPICDQCACLIELGKALPNAAFISFTSESRNEEDGRAGDRAGNNAFPGVLFDGGLRFFREKPKPQDVKDAMQILSVKGEVIFTVAPVAGHVPVIAQKDLDRWKYEGRLRDGLLHDEVCDCRAPKTFTMLAEEGRIPPREAGEPWRSIACLGICKADVDNLGLIFSMGFGDSFSLASFSMLARMLNQFFSGYLIKLLEDKDSPFGDIYVVFAGGDDVFVLGPWTQAIKFALRMERDFRRFCGENPAVTISAGLPLLKPGLPMRAIRTEAEEALERSKDFTTDLAAAEKTGEVRKKSGGKPAEGGAQKDVKNALTLLGVSAHWFEADRLLEIGAWLEDLVLQGVISTGFLRRLLGYSRMCAAFYRGEDLARNGLYQSHVAYDLARNWPPGHADQDLLRLKELVNKKELFSRAEMGIAWALYRTRISA